MDGEEGNNLYKILI